MKTLLVLALLSFGSLAYAEPPEEPSQAEQAAATQADEHTPHSRKKRAIGSSAGIPCAAGSKMVGNDCVPMAEFD